MSSFAWWDARVTFWNTIEILLAKLKETIWRLTKTKLLCKQSANLKEKWWRYFQSYSNVLRARGILKFSQKKKASEQPKAVREKCPYSEFFWSVSSGIWIEYGETLRISPYSVRMRENTDLKNSEYGHFSRSEIWVLPCMLNTEPTPKPNNSKDSSIWGIVSKETYVDKNLFLVFT